MKVVVLTEGHTADPVRALKVIGPATENDQWPPMLSRCCYHIWHSE